MKYKKYGILGIGLLIAFFILTIMYSSAQPHYSDILGNELSEERVLELKSGNARESLGIYAYTDGLSIHWYKKNMYFFGLPFTFWLILITGTMFGFLFLYKVNTTFDILSNPIRWKLFLFLILFSLFIIIADLLRYFNFERTNVLIPTKYWFSIALFIILCIFFYRTKIILSLKIVLFLIIICLTFVEGLLFETGIHQIAGIGDPYIGLQDRSYMTIFEFSDNAFCFSLLGKFSIVYLNRLLLMIMFITMIKFKQNKKK